MPFIFDKIFNSIQEFDIDATEICSILQLLQWNYFWLHYTSYCCLVTLKVRNY